MSSIDFDKISHKCNFRKNISHVFFFLSAIIDVEGVKTTLKVIRGSEHISSNISEITEDTVFVKFAFL